jgi:hypothetical protein
MFDSNFIEAGNGNAILTSPAEQQAARFQTAARNRQELLDGNPADAR